MTNLIINFLFWSFAISAIRAEDPIKINKDSPSVPVHLIEKISIIIAQKWYINICAEGSSYLNYGEGPMDVARIPEEKVSLVKIYSKINKNLVFQPEELDSNDIVLVNLILKKSSSIKNNVVRYMEANEAYKIFNDLVVEGLPYDKQIFEMLLNKYPPNTSKNVYYHYDENGRLHLEIEQFAETKHSTKTKQQDIHGGEQRIFSEDKIPTISAPKNHSVSKKLPEAKSPSTRWITIVILTAAAIGLAWLLLKKLN